MRETSTHKEHGRGGHSRRELIAGALGAVAATTLAGAVPARAAQGQAVIEGADNTGATARTGIFTTNNSEWAVLADTGQSASDRSASTASAKVPGVTARRPPTAPPARECSALARATGLA